MVIDITSGFLCASQTAAANNGSSGAVSEIVPAQPSKEWDAITDVTVGASAGMFTEFFELYIFGC